MSANNDLAWFVSYVKGLVEEGITGSNISTMIGEVISSSPIRIKAADLVLEGEDLLIPDLYKVETVNFNLTGDCGDHSCQISGTIEWPLRLEEGDIVTLNLVGNQFLMTSKVVAADG